MCDRHVCVCVRVCARVSTGHAHWCHLCEPTHQTGPGCKPVPAPVCGVCVRWHDSAGLISVCGGVWLGLYVWCGVRTAL